MKSTFDRMRSDIIERRCTVGVIGLGYVGLPLAVSAAEAGFHVIGFDIDESKIPMLEEAQSYIDAVSDEALRAVRDSRKFCATSDMQELKNVDIVVICVPTPLNKYREPDLSYVVNTAEMIAEFGKNEKLVVLESTTWPGTTKEVLLPILDCENSQQGKALFVGFSPEREDPGNAHFKTTNTPKIVSGVDQNSLELVREFYNLIVGQIVPTSNTETAEAVKITENVFRSINIALVNELKVIFHEMGIDVWEVIDAAKTKPFGYMPFYPGPGLGGHCIPIDPFYLSWKAREFGLSTKFIELAGEINQNMPSYVVSKTERALDETMGLSLGRANILIVGAAYKGDVADIRESPALRIMETLQRRHAKFAYFDPFVERIPKTRDHPSLSGLDSLTQDEVETTNFDVAMIITDHEQVDYVSTMAHIPLIIDTRNALEKRGVVGAFKCVRKS